MISNKEFLTNRDETGRLIVKMLDGTNKQYFVEFIEPKGGVKTNYEDKTYEIEEERRQEEEDMKLDQERDKIAEEGQ